MWASGEGRLPLRTTSCAQLETQVCDGQLLGDRAIEPLLLLAGIQSRDCGVVAPGQFFTAS
jgi:hypothetical protein